MTAAPACSTRRAGPTSRDFGRPGPIGRFAARCARRLSARGRPSARAYRSCTGRRQQVLCLRVGPPALRPGSGLRRPGLLALDLAAGCWGSSPRGALTIKAPTWTTPLDRGLCHCPLWTQGCSKVARMFGGERTVRSMIASAGRVRAGPVFRVAMLSSWNTASKAALYCCRDRGSGPSRPALAWRSRPVRLLDC